MDDEQEKRWFELTDKLLRKLKERDDQIMLLKHKLDTFTKSTYEQTTENLKIRSELLRLIGDSVAPEVRELIDNIG